MLVIKTIKKALEQMSENEEFMNAIREDMMAAQQNEY